MGVALIQEHGWAHLSDPEQGGEDVHVRAASLPVHQRCPIHRLFNQRFLRATRGVTAQSMTAAMAGIMRTRQIPDKSSCHSPGCGQRPAGCYKEYEER